MAIALMPNSCELVDSLGRSWAIQVKPAGSDPAKYAFVPGVTSCQVNLETTGTDSTTIDMDGWSGETKTGRSLNVVLEGIYKLINGLAALPKTLELLEATGESLGALGTIDVRVWRTDVDKGWEFTANNNWSGAGDATGFRTFTSTLGTTCAPTRIHSVQEGATQAESVPVTDEEFMAIFGDTTPVTPEQDEAGTP